MGGEPLEDGFLADLVDRVDRVGGGDGRDIREGRRFLLPRGEKGIADVVLQVAEQDAEAVELGGSHRLWWMEETARSSAAFSSGFDSFVIEPPPISGPARYFIVSGLRSGG